MTESYKTLKPGFLRVLSASRIHQMVTGVVGCVQTKDGTITLTYEDGSKESRQTNLDIEEFENGLIGIVSFVQAGRSAA